MIELEPRYVGALLMAIAGLFFIVMLLAATKEWRDRNRPRGRG